VVSNDPEIQQFINSIGERKVNQMMIDFFEEGKRDGDSERQSVAERS